MLPTLKIYTTVEDLKYILFDHPDIISDQIKENGSWIPQITQRMEQILSNQGESGNVIDIGSGFGSISIPLAARFYPRFTFFAFEPLRIINLQLGTNVLLNYLDNIIPYNVGLGDCEETLEFYTVDYTNNGNHGSFSFNHSINEIRGIIPTKEKQNYMFKTLDSYNFDNVKLIKLSAPGMEKKVLDGAKQTIINNNLPPIVFEEWKSDWYTDQLKEIYDVLTDIGYKEFDQFDSHIFVFKDVEEKEKLLFSSTTQQRNKAFSEFNVTEKSHDAELTLRDQKPLMP
jgi:FkbM family methyltransferase